jgi:hypothetical protein
MMVYKHIFLVIMIVCCLLVIFNIRCRRIAFLILFIMKSSQYTSYSDWTQFCRGHLSSSCFNYVKPLEEPHLILLNHITSHEYMGSFLASTIVAGQKPCKIVCYADYRHFVKWPVYPVMNNILQDEIRVKKDTHPIQKEQYLVKEIKTALSKNFNVVMFIDAHKCDSVVMRSLYKAILLQFPHTYKQYFQLHEPTHNDVTTFDYRAFPPTLELNDIITIRQRIIEQSTKT